MDFNELNEKYQVLIVENEKLKNEINDLKARLNLSEVKTDSDIGSDSDFSTK